YAISGRLTRKSDIYSFGVLLLEVVSGRKVVDFDMEHGEHYLVQKAWEAYKGDELIQLVDFVLETNFPEEEAVRFIKIGFLCVQEHTSLRPSMATAIKMLANEISLRDVEVSQPWAGFRSHVYKNGPPAFVSKHFLKGLHNQLPKSSYILFLTTMFFFHML
ncbi:hypothetical protein F8388_003345, partial [Cannabis sativa]